MPITKVMAVRDSAVNAFGRPHFVPATGAAIRAFGDEINRAAADNPMYQHPDDFELWILGDYDDETGQFSQTEPPKLLTRGKDIKNTAE